jgi:hypothetical protein
VMDLRGVESVKCPYPEVDVSRVMIFKSLCDNRVDWHFFLLSIVLPLGVIALVIGGTGWRWLLKLSETPEGRRILATVRDFRAASLASSSGSTYMPRTRARALKLLARCKFFLMFAWNLWDWVLDVQVYNAMYLLATEVINLCPAANQASTFLSAMDYTSFIEIYYAVKYGGVVLDNSTVYFTTLVSLDATYYPQDFSLEVQRFTEVCRRFHRFPSSDECAVNPSDYSCYMREVPNTFDWFTSLLIISVSIVLLKELVKLVLIVYILVSRKEPASSDVYPFVSSSVFCPLLMVSIPFEDRIIQHAFRERDILIAFFFDGVLENMNQLLVMYLYVYNVSGSRITFSTMVSVFMNLSMISFALLRVVTMRIIKMYGQDRPSSSATVGVDVEKVTRGPLQVVRLRSPAMPNRAHQRQSRASFIAEAILGLEAD